LACYAEVDQMIEVGDNRMALHVPGYVGFFNPIARRVLKAGALLGPNALLTVRGRKSGEPRTTPVALVEIDGRRWVIGTFGETNWVRNLRVAGEATVSVGKHHEDVKAAELVGDARVSFFRDVLTPYVRRLRIGTLLLTVLGARDIVDDPAAAAEKRPVFELRAA
jgi:deazaflavin-dependent oxidoreductase (nitroreductase family)